MERHVNLIASLLGILTAVVAVGAWLLQRHEEATQRNVTETKTYLELLRVTRLVSAAKAEVFEFDAKYSRETKPAIDSDSRRSFNQSALTVSSYFAELWHCTENGKCEWSVLAPECQDAQSLFDVLQRVEDWYGKQKKSTGSPWEKLVERCRSN